MPKNILKKETDKTLGMHTVAKISIKSYIWQKMNKMKTNCDLPRVTRCWRSARSQRSGEAQLGKDAE